MKRAEVKAVIESRINAGEIESILSAEELTGYVCELREYVGYGEVGTYDVYGMMKENYIDLTEYGIDEWNEYCYDEGYSDDVLYSNDEMTINDLFNSPYDAIANLNGEYDGYAQYIKFTIWGWETVDDIEEIMDDDNFKEWLIDNDRHNCNEVSEILDNIDEIVDLANEFEVIDD